MVKGELARERNPTIANCGMEITGRKGKASRPSSLISGFAKHRP
jgi:hypothetical protein